MLASSLQRIDDETWLSVKRQSKYLPERSYTHYNDKSPYTRCNHDYRDKLLLFDLSHTGAVISAHNDMHVQDNSTVVYIYRVSAQGSNHPDFCPSQVTHVAKKAGGRDPESVVTSKSALHYQC